MNWGRAPTMVTIFIILQILRGNFRDVCDILTFLFESKKQVKGVVFYYAFCSVGASDTVPRLLAFLKSAIIC